MCIINVLLVITVLNYYKTVIKSSIFIEYSHFLLRDLTLVFKRNMILINLNYLNIKDVSFSI